jgi:ABC-type sugar transport system ATPase subunit
LRVDWRTLYEKTEKLLDEIGAECGVRDELSGLTAGQIQMVQIAAALATGARILVMDEPTSSLSLAEARRLEELISSLRTRGTTFLYISHRMEETFRICDSVTVLRDGRHVATMPLAQSSEKELIQLMIGRVWEKFFPGHTGGDTGGERLRVEGISSPGKFRDISFAVHSGEVLGVAGLMGAGRSEVALGIFGLDRNMKGRLFVDGREVAIDCPSQAMALGIGLVSEDRKGQGLVLDMSCGENITLASLDRLSRFGIIRLPQERGVVTNYLQRLRVRTPSPDAPAQVLSGGNQQKLVLAKWLARECHLLILDEPTRGVDVAAKAEFHRLIDELAVAGLAILMISSELPELLNLSTRVLVMRHGRQVGILDRSEATEERLMQLMAGRAEADFPGAQEAEANN